MSELVRRTGVPAATVHHYRRVGLLPPAKRAARNRFLYDERHVRALRLIRLLRERRGLALPLIRRLLPELLALEEAEAFRPEMWDRLVDLRAASGGRRPAGLRLLDVAIEAFGRHGYAGANVDEICRAARVAKGSFYRHHRSKEELFFAAAEAVTARIGEAVAEARPRDEAAARAVLADQLQPSLRILFDLVAWAAQRGPRATVARATVAAFVDGLGRLVAPDRPRPAGTRLLAGAVAVLLERALEARAPLAGSGGALGGAPAS
jgi:AcrR family transcriptional regulator